MVMSLFEVLASSGYGFAIRKFREIWEDSTLGISGLLVLRVLDALELGAPDHLELA
jgi:hypothetical protein